MDKKIYFFLKLNPPRPSFVMDMTEEEKSVMQAHVAYWEPFIQDGTALVMGPVLDPKGGYGIAVIRVENEEELNSILAKDPVNGLAFYTVHPMRVATKY